MQRIGPSDVSGAIAFIVSPAKDGADSWRSQDTLDTESMADNVRKLVEAGIGGIATQGTTGEGNQLTEDEFHAVVETVVGAAGGRVPVFAGVTSLNTRDTIRRAEYAEAHGVQGVLSGLPMWSQLSIENAVQYYRDLAEAMPRLGVMVYENPWAFRVSFTQAAWKELSLIPNVVAAKTTSDPFTMVGAFKQVGDRLTLMPIDRILPYYWEYGARACWTTDVSLGPWLVLAMVHACREGNLAEARRIQLELNQLDEQYGLGHQIHQYSSAWHKLNADAAGWTRGGPSRPPLMHFPPGFEEKAHEFGRRYAAMAERFRPDVEARQQASKQEPALAR